MNDVRADEIESNQDDKRILLLRRRDDGQRDDDGTDRHGHAGDGHGNGHGPSGMPTGASMPTGTSWMMVPRCTITMEKCTGGMKMTCTCDDEMSAAMMQNLCTMMAGGMCSCCMMMNGMMVCCCNLTMGMCKCEMTDDGVCITCTSGDAEVLRDDPGLLRLHDGHDEGRLHLLHHA